MPFSFQDHTGDGTTKSFSFSLEGVDKGYWSDDQIEVSVNGIVVPHKPIPTSTNTLELIIPPPLGSLVRVRRKVPADRPYAEFKRGTDFTEKNMNRSFQQTLYLMQTLLDGFVPDGFYFKQDMNMGGYAVKGLKDGVDPQDAATIQQMGSYRTEVQKLHKEVTDAAASLKDGIAKLANAQQILDNIIATGQAQFDRVTKTGSDQNARLIQTGGEQAALSERFARQAADSLNSVDKKVEDAKNSAKKDFESTATAKVKEAEDEADRANMEADRAKGYADSIDIRFSKTQPSDPKKGTIWIKPE